MGGEQASGWVARADLCDRLDRLQRAAEHMNVRDLDRDIATIRALAAAYGLAPVVALADALHRAVRAQPRFCPAGLYLERLRDAIGCAPLVSRPALALVPTSRTE
jgi:hypothetical protein